MRKNSRPFPFSTENRGWCDRGEKIRLNGLLRANGNCKKQEYGRRSRLSVIKTVYLIVKYNERTEKPSSRVAPQEFLPVPAK